MGRERTVIRLVFRVTLLAVVAAAWLPLFGQVDVMTALSASPEAWDGDPLSWVSAGESQLRFSGQSRDLSMLRQAPVCRRAVVEATIRVEEALGDGWKIAAVALAADSNNFWHVALVQAPAERGGLHSMELMEMLEGVWLSQRNLVLDVDEISEDGWRFGRSYRLRLELDPQGVQGTVTDASGKRLFRRRYAFSAAAVRSGRPALRCGGFDATYGDIRAAWAEPLPTASGTSRFPAYQSDRFVPDLSARKTGFFHLTEDAAGRFWVIDPLGRGFIPLGVDHVRYAGSWCETLGYSPHGRKNDAKYRNREAWARETLDRLRSWGFNLLTAGGDPMLFRRGLGHTLSLNVGNRLARMGDPYDITPHEGRPCTAFPNVFHPRFAAYCDYRARQVCAPGKGDPWLFGYFLDNELAWWGRGDVETGLFDAALKKDAAHSAKITLRDCLQTHFRDDIKMFNDAFHTELASFEAVLQVMALPTPGEPARRAKQAFLELIADRYFGTLSHSIRACDPDHMILGCRFAGGRLSDIVWRTAGRHCDILSFNYYGSVDLDRGIALASTGGEETRLEERFQEFFVKGGRPMMVTEWSFPALDSGLPCTNGAGQRFRTQRERARASDIYARTILRLPFMVGYDYFMWVDQPALGISSTFPENSNYGIVNEDGMPYEELAAVLSRIHRVDAPALRREGAAGFAGPIRRPDPPEGPAGTDVVLWNWAEAGIAAGPIWLPLNAERVRAAPAFRGRIPEGFAWWKDGQWRVMDTQIVGRQSYPRFPAAAVVVLEAWRETEARFLKIHPSTRVAVSDSRPVFTRDGSAFEARTDVWQVRGEIGGAAFLPSVIWRGVSLGSYSGMIQQYPGENRWLEINRVTQAEADAGALALAVTLTGEYRGGDDRDRAGEFELVHRLTFLPAQDWFVAELVSIRNLSPDPLDLRAAFFRLHGAVGGSVERDRPIRQGGVPRLWGRPPGDGWVDSEHGIYWGATSPAGRGVSVRFWLNQQGGQHPDARWRHEETIAPGAAFTPSRPVFVFCLAGRGDATEWDRVSAEVVRRAEVWSR